MSLWIYVDGKYVSKEEAKISVFNHGFLYGDGVFEGIRAYGGKVFKLEEHLKRLYNSAKSISLEIPLSREDLREKVLETLRKNKLKDAYIRLVVSRGEGDLGLDPRKCPHPQVIIIAHHIMMYSEELYEKGLEVIISSTRKNIPAALDPRIKSLNYLNNILAKIEANIQGASEAIMLNKDGYIAECTGDNIFIVKEGTLITPPIWVGALEGITHNVILKLAAKEGIPTKEEPFTISSLYNSEECFLTGTAAEIAPVTRIDKKIIGEGKVGKITRKLIKNFRQLTQIEGTSIY